MHQYDVGITDDTKIAPVTITPVGTSVERTFAFPAIGFPVEVLVVACHNDVAIHIFTVLQYGSAETRVVTFVIVHQVLAGCIMSPA